MSPTLNIKKVNCDICHRKYKTAKHDILTVADNCPNTNCGLRTNRYANIMSILGAKKPAANDDEEILEFDDVIVVKTDKHGNERTLP